jgi:hypothetical protein
MSDTAGLAHNNRSGGNRPHNLIEIRDWAVLSAHERFHAFVDLE